MIESHTFFAALYALPTLVWGVFTRQLWIHRRTRPEPSQLFGPAMAATTFITMHGAIHVVEAFVPAGAVDASTFAVARATTLLAATAAGRHALRAMQLPETRPGRRWLAVNYGLLLAFALPMAAVLVVPSAPAGRVRAGEALAWSGIAVFVVLCLQQATRMSTPSPWGP